MLGMWCTAFKKREQNNGITVIATTNEASSDKQNASASAEKRTWQRHKENDGEEVDDIHQVAANTARFTSAPPTSAADHGAAPSPDGGRFLKRND